MQVPEEVWGRPSAGIVEEAGLVVAPETTRAEAHRSVGRDTVSRGLRNWLLAVGGLVAVSGVAWAVSSWALGERTELVKGNSFTAVTFRAEIGEPEFVSRNLLKVEGPGVLQVTGVSLEGVPEGIAVEDTWMVRSDGEIEEDWLTYQFDPVERWPAEVFHEPSSVHIDCRSAEEWFLLASFVPRRAGTFWVDGWRVRYRDGDRPDSVVLQGALGICVSGGDPARCDPHEMETPRRIREGRGRD